MCTNKYYKSTTTPSDWYGHHYLFIKPKMGRFVAQKEGDHTVMVTGVYHSEDMSLWLLNTQYMKRIVAIESRRMKKSGQI